MSAEQDRRRAAWAITDGEVAKEMANVTKKREDARSETKANPLSQPLQTFKKSNYYTY